MTRSWNTILRHGVLAAATMLLCACGGGRPEPSAPASSAAPSVSEVKRQAMAIESAVVLTDELRGQIAGPVLDDIEHQYAAYFPAGDKATNQVSGPYVYRCYPSTNNCVGMDKVNLYAMGPAVASPGTPVAVGTIAAFCASHPAACAATSERSLTVAGQVRRYIVHRSWGSLAKAASPVVFMLHGTSGSGGEFFQTSGWREKADAEGFIAVFPSALRHCYLDDGNHNQAFEATEIETFSKWADSRLGGPAMPLCTADQLARLPDGARAATDHALADDMGFFRAMVADLGASTNADAHRIYVSGFSNGGQMAFRLAVEASDLFAAVASNAGAIPGGFATPAARPISMIFAVGELDDRFTWALSPPAIPVATDQGGSGAWPSIVGPFLNALGLAQTPYTFQTATLSGELMGLYHYTTSTRTPTGDNEFYAAVIQGRGHVYPPYMPDLLWPWFMSKRLP